jgi:hypothetical protein
MKPPQDLWAASVGDDVRAEGVRRRWLVATGDVCPCGARVVSWIWTDRVAGVPEPKTRVVYHEDGCPALLEPA